MPSPKGEEWLGRAQAFPLDRVKPHIHTNRTPSTGSGWATALAPVYRHCEKLLLSFEAIRLY
ncbi:MAG: hypothetical protein F9K23_16555 [Bacteroidetes bacterium]|nr:MAG: hypothetical protein F9K23_16555 [Bacteroidota bacterium]